MPPIDPAQLLSGPLANTLGVAGVLGWFLWKTDGRLDKMAASVDRLSRAILLDVVAGAPASEPARRQARAMLEELTPAEAARR
jgi:hypothetical protein